MNCENRNKRYAMLSNARIFASFVLFVSIELISVQLFDEDKPK